MIQLISSKSRFTPSWIFFEISSVTEDRQYRTHSFTKQTQQSLLQVPNLLSALIKQPSHLVQETQSQWLLCPLNPSWVYPAFSTQTHQSAENHADSLLSFRLSAVSHCQQYIRVPGEYLHPKLASFELQLWLLRRPPPSHHHAY